MVPFQRLLMLVAQHRRAVWLIITYSIFGGLISLALPLGVQAIIGLIQGGTTSAALWLLIGAIAAGLVLTAVLRIMQLFVTEKLQRALFIGSSFEFAQRMPALRLDQKIQEYLPELANRFFDTLTVQKNLPKVILDFSASALQILFGLILLSLYSSFFAFFGVLLLFFLFLIFRLTGRRGLESSIKESKYKYQTAFWLEELARSAAIFKLFPAGELQVRRIDGIAQNWLGARKKHFKILMWQFGSIMAFKVLITVGLLVVGSILVINNQINIGQFVAAELVVILVVEATEKLILSIEMLYDLLTSVDKIGGVFDLELDRADGVDLPCEKGETGLAISLRNVRYRYPKALAPTLDGIDLDIRAGEKICVIGHKGSGKSTLLGLFSTVLADFEGQILLQSIPLSNLKLPTVRNRIGLVSLYRDIFSGTLVDNLTLGNTAISTRELIEVCEKTGLDGFIQSHPEGIQAELTATGRNISGSVATKIKVARALLKKPDLLVIEEAFSHLEAPERQKITEAVLDPTLKKTVIAISNDPFFAKKCDRVLVLDDGKVVADGPFEVIFREKRWHDLLIESDLVE